MEFQITERGFWGGNGSEEVRIKCLTTEEFLTLPTKLLIDNKIFTKRWFRLECQFAGYEGNPSVVVFDSSRSGTFEIVVGDKEITRTTITVA